MVLDSSTTLYGELGSKYEIVVKDISWEDAKKECEEKGGHLATITSQREQDYIATLNPNCGRYWIGGYRDEEFKWMWVTGEEWEYTNWNTGEPNNSGAVKPNETKITLWSGNRWNDLNENNLSEQSGYICEWD